MSGRVCVSNQCAPRRDDRAVAERHWRAGRMTRIVVGWPGSMTGTWITVRHCLGFSPGCARSPWGRAGRFACATGAQSGPTPPSLRRVRSRCSVVVPISHLSFGRGVRAAGWFCTRRSTERPKQRECLFRLVLETSLRAPARRRCRGGGDRVLAPPTVSPGVSPTQAQGRSRAVRGEVGPGRGAGTAGAAPHSCVVTARDDIARSPGPTAKRLLEPPCPARDVVSGAHGEARVFSGVWGRAPARLALGLVSAIARLVPDLRLSRRRARIDVIRERWVGGGVAFCPRAWRGGALRGSRLLGMGRE